MVLSKDILKLKPCSSSPELSTPFALSLPLPMDASHSPEIVLHPSYPAIKPLCSGGGQIRSSVFGNRFGVPFCDHNGVNYCRPLSCTELLGCYSHPKEIIPERTLWPRLDIILDALLPASLPLEFTSCIASSELRLGRVYDEQVIVEDDYSHNARCCLISKAPSTIFNWSVSYHEDDDTRKIFTALRLSNRKAIPHEVIASVAMGYRHHLKSNLIQILGENYFC